METISSLLPSLPPPRGPRPSRGPRDDHPRLKREAHVEELIGYVLEHRGLTQAVRRLNVLILWEGLVGVAAARNSVAEGLDERGVLRVWAKSSAWIQELSIRRAAMIGQINQLMGRPILVRDIRFHLLGGRLLASDVQQAWCRRKGEDALRRQPPPQERPKPAEGSSREQIRAACGAVEDPDLRALIESVRTRWDR